MSCLWASESTPARNHRTFRPKSMLLFTIRRAYAAIIVDHCLFKISCDHALFQQMAKLCRVGTITDYTSQGATSRTLSWSLCSGKRFWLVPVVVKFRHRGAKPRMRAGPWGVCHVDA